MSEFAFKSYLVGLGLPVLFSFLCLIATKPWTANRPRFGHLVGTVAFGVGYFGFYAWLGIAPLRPINSEHYIVYAAELALLVGLAQAMIPSPDCLRWRFRFVALLICAVFLVPDWDDLQTMRAWWILGMTAVMFESWNILTALAKRVMGVALPLALTVVALAGAAVLFQSGSAKFAQSLALAGALLAGISIANAWLRQTAAMEGIVPGIAVVIPAWMMTGKLYTFSNVPNWSFGLIAAAPLAMALALIPLPKSMAPGLRHWFAVGVTCAVAGVAVFLAFGSAGGESEW